MSKPLTITDEATGQEHHGTLPAGWHEVPLSTFLRYYQLQQQHPTDFAFQHVIAALTGLPQEVLAEDESIAAILAPHLAFFHEGLPADPAAPEFEHEGRIYVHVGDVLRLSATRYAYVLDQLNTVRDRQPVQATAQLLAVLYPEAGHEQTLEQLGATAERFLSLPMSLAWPAYQQFLSTWQQAVLNVSRYQLAQAQAETAVEMLEHAIAPPEGGQPLPLVPRAMRGLMRSYLRSVRRQLSTTYKS